MSQRSGTIVARTDAILDTLADALLPHLLPKIREALAVDRDDATKLMTPRDTPSPRATMEACRRGLLSAKKINRKWTFTVAAWRTYVDKHGTQKQAVDSVAVVDEGESADLSALRRELGFAQTARSQSVPKSSDVHPKR